MAKFRGVLRGLANKVSSNELALLIELYRQTARCLRAGIAPELQHKKQEGRRTELPEDLHALAKAEAVGGI